MGKHTYIELLIEVLLEHEKELDELVSRLEKVYTQLTSDKILRMLAGLAIKLGDLNL